MEENRTKSNADKLQHEAQLHQYRLIIDQNKAEIQRLYDLIEDRKNENEALEKEV